MGITARVDERIDINRNGETRYETFICQCVQSEKIELIDHVISPIRYIVKKPYQKKVIKTLPLGKSKG